MAFYGVGLDVKVRELNLQLKLAIQSRGGNSLGQLKRIFKQADFNGNGKLDPSEFEDALREFRYFPSLTSRVFFKKVELQALMKYYDADGDGNISWNEFVKGLK